MSRARRDRHFAPFVHHARWRRAAGFAIGSGVVVALAWASMQPYLMVTSVFPGVSTLGAAVPLLAACTSVPPARFDTSDARTRLAVAMERERIGRFIELIAAEQPEVRLICFGEASLRWYWTGARSARYHRSMAEPLDGGIFNAALIVDDRGEIVAHRRKSHFVPYDTLSGFTRGERTVTTATIDTVKVAMLICNDFNSLRYRRAIHGDSDIKVLLLPHATANLEPNGYMVTSAVSGPGYFVYGVPIR